MLTGHCLCGAIQYEIDVVPATVYYCHCSQCRRASGSSFTTNLLVNQQNFQITAGEPLLRCFKSSTGKQRYFCSICGSPIFTQAASFAPFVSVRCGTLNSSAEIQPQAHLWVGSKAPWTEISDALPQYTENPPFN
jgi:hypothetical protein